MERDRTSAAGMTARGTTALAVLLAATALALAFLHRGHAVSWDEIEFYRATRWIAEGRVPFRDYWEHHLPLQWFLFAPAAAATGGMTVVGAVVVMRWVQLPVWVAILMIACRFARCAGISHAAILGTLALAIASPWFIGIAVEYRLDVPGNLAYLASVALVVSDSHRRGRWMLFGALMSAAVLFNMRLAPLVILTSLLMALRDSRRDAWSLSARPLWMVAGALPVAAVFVGYLFVTDAWEGFREGVFQYNVLTARMLPEEASSFGERLLAPFAQRDPAAIAFILLAAAGAALAGWRRFRPDVLLILTILTVFSLLVVASMGVHYSYHLQNAFLLLIPLAASAVDRLGRFGWLPPLAAAAAIVTTLASTAQGFGSEMAYQTEVVREAADRTRPGEAVWDGCGYVTGRRAAYRYWFLPFGVKMLAEAEVIDPYDLEQAAADPPAAIVYNYRIETWMRAFPRLEGYVRHHYVPLYQNLWIPGMNGVLGPEPSAAAWIVPRSGSYDLWVSPLLSRHPWFTSPRRYGLLDGVELEIPLDRLPRDQGGVVVRVDGRALPSGVRRLNLRRGSRVEIEMPAPAGKVGVMFVPSGITRLSVMPDRRLTF